MRLRTWSPSEREIAIILNEHQAWEEIVREWKQIDRMKDLNQRLYDELGGCLMYIIEYAERNNIVLPNRDRLYRMVENLHVTCNSVMYLYRRINTSSPTRNQHDFKHGDDSTEPKISIRFGVFTNIIFKKSI
jgi:hypothetical protein